MNKLKIVLFSFLLFAGLMSAKAQSVAVTPGVICSGNLATIKVTVPQGKTATKFEFDLYNDNSTVKTTTDAQYTWLYAPGTYQVKVTITYSDNSKATAVSQSFNVYHLPVINASVLSQDTQCYRGNLYIFKNLGGQNPLSPSNPINFYYWNYGDASGDTLYTNANTTHTYNSPITQTTGISVLLSATDNKGCRKDSLFQAFIALKPNIQPNFKWTFVSGPCFVSCYQFQNLSTPHHDSISSYTWDFGDGNSFSGIGYNDPNNHYDTITHCYRIDGQFNPALILADLTGCIDSTRKKNNNTTQILPQNINFKFDVVTTKSATDLVTRKDTVCSGSGNAKNICYRMTPVSFAQSGAGDFVWNFGDPNDPQLKNLDSTSWNPCHLYSGMGTFFPSITIKNVCPDTTFIYHSVLSTYSKIDSAAYPDNDWGPNPTPPPGAQTLPYKFPAPIDFQDSTNLTSLNATANIPQLAEQGLNDVVAAFNYPGKGTVYFMRNDPLIDDGSGGVKSTLRLPVNHVFKLKRIPDSKPLLHRSEPVYGYTLEFNRPVVLMKKSPLITDLSNNVLDSVFLYYDLLNQFNISSYGVEVIGPTSGIEAPPVPVVIKASQKNQCGPTDTVDFVNTSSYFKSRKIWRRWDFDDNFAPQCTSFSVPRRGFPLPGPVPGSWGVGPWTTAVQQDFNSDHYFIANGVTYPGRMSCKFSFDSLPRYAYPHWDTVYLWYRLGHDFFPWDVTRFDTNFPPPAGKAYVQPWDQKYWGKPVYLNVLTGEWSLVPGSSPMQHTIKTLVAINPLNGQPFTRYYIDTIPTTNVPNTVMVPWPRIDTMNLRTNNGQDLQPGSPLLIQNIPDPFGLARGKYLVLNGPQLDTSTIFNVNYKGDQWILDPRGVIPPTVPNGSWKWMDYATNDFYHYVFRRTIQRCLTVRQKLRDTVNNESFDPGGPFDDQVLDDKDCEDEATVQLALGKADARGLSIGGKICPGLTTNSFGANVRFSFSQLGIYPGIKPSCGQTFVLFNYDSLADRKDLTPCDLDGFVTFQGGLTPGGLNRPPFFSQADFNPLSVWTSPAGTTFIYHYGNLTGTPPPADTANGWITVGLQVGNGCKDTVRKNVLYSQFKGDPAYQQNIVTASNNYSYNRIFNIRSLAPIPDSSIDVEYVDCNAPRCTSSPIWYHNFLRIINLDAGFIDFPQQLPTAVWKLRGKGDKITVYYTDSVQDSVKYDSWQWGDATVTVDSFWYSGDDTTDGFYTHGIRRVRYNIDQLDPNNPIIIDSTVWPIRASYPGANDGLVARTPGKYKPVSYDTLDYCTGLGKQYPSYIIVDTAMMFLPITHTYRRTSWEADNRIDPYKGPDANISFMIHLVVSTAGCQQVAGKPITIGVIDTFQTMNGKGEFDSVFCVNETVYFYDSVRYWRYDASITSLPLNPGGTRNPVMNNYQFTTFGFPENLHQIDTFNFWLFRNFDPLDFKGGFYKDSIYLGHQYLYNYGLLDTIRRTDSIFTERIYWDFGDGETGIGRDPSGHGLMTHKYAGYGRYKVTMYSRDSMGFWDTCVRYVNIVKPVARIGLIQDLFNCGIPAVPMWDSSYMVFGTGPKTTDSVQWQYWWFGDNKNDTINPFTAATGNPKPEYPYRQNGKFRIKLAVQTFQGCFDTTTRDIFIKGPRPRFRVLTDTVGCSPFRVAIINLADSADQQAPNDTPTRETIIDWGDGIQSPSSTEPAIGRRDTLWHSYPDSGVFTITAIGTDRDPISGLTTCLPQYYPDTVGGLERPIRIHLVKFPVSMEVSKHHVCIDEVFQVNNTSDPNYTSYRYEFWHKGVTFLDSVGQIGTTPITVDHSFDSAGLYTIYGYPTGFNNNIPVASRANCARVDTMLVLVHEPLPDFSIDTTGYPKYKFTNYSDSAFYYTWSIEDSNGVVMAAGTKNGNINDKDWAYDLGDNLGRFKVCLIAYTIDSLGKCPDTVCKEIKNFFKTSVKIFNVFSPNSDNSNDFFKIIIEGQTDYDLQIFNRWGDVVFESKDALKLWDGTNKNDGSDCPDGVYYFVFNYKFRGQSAFRTENGTVTLVR